MADNNRLIDDDNDNVLTDFEGQRYIIPRNGLQSSLKEESEDDSWSSPPLPPIPVHLQQGGNPMERWAPGRDQRQPQTGCSTDWQKPAGQPQSRRSADPSALQRSQAGCFIDVQKAPSSA